MVTTTHHITPATQQVWSILNTIPDPEVPVLSILDLGIVRQVEITENNKVAVTITPTYTGCPAMDVIRISIHMALLSNGFTHIDIRTILSPAWTTEWLSQAGRQKLQAYGIAPPISHVQQPHNTSLFSNAPPVTCPHCGSHHTRLLSQFGSTACKALYQCTHCREPFDYFKCH